MKEKQAWYIFYTHPRSEKKARDALASMKLEVYLPLKEEFHDWKNRQKKLILKPLFPSYIFVRTSPSLIYKVLQLPNITRYIGYGSTPSTISSEEITLIQKTLDSNVDPFMENGKVIGKTAKIIHGPCRGCEGILYERNGRDRFLIQISDNLFNLSIKVKSKNLRIIAST